MTFDIKLSDAVLTRRVYNEATNRSLQANTILAALGPFVDKKKTSIDVGAATGHITNYLAPRSKEVWAFEAVYPVWQQLCKMQERHDNLNCVNYAVSDFNGKSKFFVDDKRLSNSSFQDLVAGPEVEVSVIALDTYFGLDKDHPAKEVIGFIKIDVEGTEVDVLHGATEMIRRDRPNVMVEIYEPYSKCPLHAIFGFFMDQNYQCYYYDNERRFGGESGLVPVGNTEEGVQAVREKHSVHDGDFLFVARIGS